MFVKSTLKLKISFLKICLFQKIFVTLHPILTATEVPTVKTLLLYETNNSISVFYHRTHIRGRDITRYKKQDHYRVLFLFFVKKNDIWLYPRK